MEVLYHSTAPHSTALVLQKTPWVAYSVISSTACSIQNNNCNETMHYFSGQMDVAIKLVV